CRPARRQRKDCGRRDDHRRHARRPEDEGVGQRAQHPAAATAGQAWRSGAGRQDAGDAETGSASAGARERARLRRRDEQSNLHWRGAVVPGGYVDQGETITIDNKVGNMTASGSVTTTTVLETTTGAKSAKAGDGETATAAKGAKAGDGGDR